jgi:hypothetical protein
MPNGRHVAAGAEARKDHAPVGGVPARLPLELAIRNRDDNP